MTYGKKIFNEKKQGKRVYQRRPYRYKGVLSRVFVLSKQVVTLHKVGLVSNRKGP